MPTLSSVAGSTGFGRQQPASGGGGGGNAITSSLTTSLASYNAASTGAWVKITSTEYASLKTNVSNLNRASATDAAFTSATSTSFSSGGLAGYNLTGAATPVILADQYIFAVAIYIAAARSDIRIYTNTNTASTSGFNQLGTTLPTTTSGANYYVRKGVAATNGATQGRAAFWVGEIINFGFAFSGGAGMGYAFSASAITSSTALSTTYGSGSALWGLQLLTTNTIQW